MTFPVSENMNKALELYNQLITDFPDSEYADMAQQNIADAATVGNRGGGENNENDPGQTGGDDDRTNGGLNGGNNTPAGANNGNNP